MRNPRDQRSDLERQSSEAIPVWERTRRQQASADLAAWATRPWLFTTISGAAGLAGGYVVGSLVFDADTPAEVGIAALVGLVGGLVVLRLLAWGYFLLRARSQQLDAAREQIEAVEKRLAAIEERVPDLSIGRAILPKVSQPLALSLPSGQTMNFLGRIIRVPVTNARGAADAESVHARITFLVGGKVDRQFGPLPTSAQWFSEQGDIEFEVDLPGNGRPRLIDLVLIQDRPYPHAHEWTIHSRAALLRGYELWSDQFEVKIEIEGKGEGDFAPAITRTLQVECGQGMLKANWLDAHPDEGTHWVGWDGQNT